MIISFNIDSRSQGLYLLLIAADTGSGAERHIDSHDVYFSPAMTSEQISPSSSSISYQQTHIKAGDNILLRTPSGDIRSIQVHDRAGRINLGKFGSFVQAHLIGQPYGLSYEILPEGSIKMKLPESLADIGEFEYSLVRMLN